MAGCVHPNTHEREKFPDKGLTCLCFLRCFDWSSFAKRHDHKPRQGESSEQNRECSGSPHLDPEFHLISGEPVKTHLVRTGTEKISWQTKVFHCLTPVLFFFNCSPGLPEFLAHTVTFFTHSKTVFSLPRKMDITLASLTLIRSLLSRLGVVKKIDWGVHSVNLL